MIRSMTGFGRAGFGVQDVRFDVEVRSVNHRFLDARIRLPKPLAPHESDVRAAIQRRFDRGKVDLTRGFAGRRGQGDQARDRPRRGRAVPARGRGAPRGGGAWAAS